MTPRSTHTLARIEPFTAEEMAGLSWADRKSLKTPLYHPPAPIRVPSPPDYSTPAAVSARARERGSGTHVTIDAEFRQLYRAFRKLVPPARIRIADMHASKWQVVRDDEGVWQMVPKAPEARRAKRGRR